MTSAMPRPIASSRPTEAAVKTRVVIIASQNSDEPSASL